MATLSLQRQERFFDLFIIFTYIFYASAIIGVTFIKPSWFLTVDFWAKIKVFRIHKTRVNKSYLFLFNIRPFDQNLQKM